MDVFGDEARLLHGLGVPGRLVNHFGFLNSNRLRLGIPLVAESAYILGDPEVTANLYCNFEYPRWRGLRDLQYIFAVTLDHPVVVYWETQWNLNISRQWVKKCP